MSEEDEEDSLETKEKLIEDFKGILIKEINKVFDAGMAGDDVVGILEAAKLMAYKRTQDTPIQPIDPKKHESMIGYR
jgi:hypothetical protein